MSKKKSFDKRMQAKIEDVTNRQQADKATQVRQYRINPAVCSMPWWKQLLWIAVWLTWLIVAWLMASTILAFILVVIRRVGGNDLMSSTVGVAIVQSSLFLLLLILFSSVPYLFGQNSHLTKAKKRSDKMHVMGLGRLPESNDLLHAVIGLAAYYLIAGLIAGLAGLVLSDGLLSQAQETGYQVIGNNWLDVVVIIVSLALVTPLLEELIFRGFLFGKLVQTTNLVPAIIVTSAVFALAHGQLNVALVTFVMSGISCLLRLKTGAIWASIGLHMFINLVASILVFILPML